MRRRTDVDESLSPVLMPGRILNELYTHALEIQPEECCGLIVGDDRERHQRLVRCRNEMTRLHLRDPLRHPRDGTEAFYMNEHDYQRAQEKAESEGLVVTAVYHSHVGSAVYFSEMDLEYAASEWFPFPDADHIVISVSDGAVRGLGLFSRRGPGEGFRGRVVKALVP
jgi:proteasome lid subunit RPN8/RPN11